MINLTDQMKKRNEWIWTNRARSRIYLSIQTGLSVSRIKHIIADMRKKIKKESVV